jgi:hypothetical protein
MNKSKSKRNSPCLCGSGKKFKRCCGARRGSQPVDKEQFVEQVIAANLAFVLCYLDSNAVLGKMDADRRPAMTRTRSKPQAQPKYKPVLKLPSLPSDQYEALRANIAVNGVLVPILVDSDGLLRGIIDGNTRKAIADELGYECPEIVQGGLEQDERRTLARALNFARRQLDPEQRRQLIADQLRETPERSNRWIGKMLGVDGKTVVSVRYELESTAEIPQLDRTVGEDGKFRPIYRQSGQENPQHYQTPPSAVTPLLKHLPKNWVVWECACGNGNIVSVLEGRGQKVIATDIQAGHDFLKWKPRRHFDCIITNPPHRQAAAFLRRCYELGKPFALLLPLLALEGQERQRLFRENGLQLLFFDKRVRYIPENQGVQRSDVPFLSAWFCHALLKKDILFEELPEN